MSWPKSIPKPIPIPPTAPDLYTVTVEVFDGPVERDEKIPGARVTLGDRSASADGAGNAHLFQVPRGVYPLEVSAPGFVSEVDRIEVPGSVIRVSLERDVPARVFDADTQLTTDGSPIFRLKGEPWRYQAVSYFPVGHLFASGADVDPFLARFPRANTVRGWDYVTWSPGGWNSIGAEGWLAVLAFLRDRGKRLNLCALTGDEPDRVQPALQLVAALCAARPSNLLIEGGNEVRINNKKIDEAALRQMFAMCQAAGIPFSSGLYIEPLDSFGTWLTNHENRDFDQPRKIGHDLLEFYNGEGPSKKSDPPHHVPCAADEPIRPDQLLAMWRGVLANGYHNSERPDIEAWVETLRAQNQDGLAERMTVQDYLAAGGGCAEMGCGGVFHFEGGKTGALPTAFEQRCAEAFFDGLTGFPASLPLALSSYRRPVEKSLRTYVVGNGMVRVRPMTPDAPEPGWTPIDSGGVLWRR